MVDGGEGSTVLHQLKRAGLDWMDMRHIFVTHKHVDHLMGIIWMVRMICQFMNHGEYKHSAHKSRASHEEPNATMPRFSDVTCGFFMENEDAKEK